MKKLLQIALLLFIAAGPASQQANAQLKLIHYWDFNNTDPCGGSGGTDLSPILPDYTSIGGASLVYDNSATTPGSCNCLTRDSIIDNGTPGDTTSSNIFAAYVQDTCTGSPNNFVRCRNPSSNMYFYWHLPTTGYKNIILNYATQTSSTTHGQLFQVLDYSVDGGSTYISAGLAFDSVNMASYVTFGTVTLDLSSITAVNNNSNFIFRLHFSGNDTIGSGNNRFDNISLQGDSMSTGIDEEIANHGYAIFPNPANNVLNITSATESDKIISIYNSVGQIVECSIWADRQIPVNIMRLSSGIYCLNIRQADGKNNYSVKFIKN